MSKRRAAAIFLSAALAAGACNDREAPPRSVWVTVHAPRGINASAGNLHVIPEPMRIESTGGDLVFQTNPTTATTTRVSAPGTCIAGVDTEQDGSRSVHLRPWLRFEHPSAPVGYGRTVTIVAQPGCAEAADTEVTWEVLDGRSDARIAFEPGGRRIEVHMPSRPAALDAGERRGVVPISAARQGRVVLRAAFTTADGIAVERRMTLAAAARATGLPNAAIGQAVLLAGEGWRVTKAPEGARAQVEAATGRAWLAPDAAGIWHLRDAADQELSLAVGRLDDVPLDCTRKGCHGDLGRAPLSPMTTVLQRGLTGSLGPDYDPRCAWACHATGEPGLDDGGFVSILADFERDLPRGDRAWEALPRALRRVGGVGCLACHGPSTIPEPSARWAILRADVCAVCHDLPPEYGHVAAWRGSRMAQADAEDGTREEPCARCHTTAGFLASLNSGTARRVPALAGPIGIACAACHDVHEHGDKATSREETAAPALLRDSRAPEWMAAPRVSVALANRSGRLCIGCHAPNPETLDPSASAAALWSGSGGLRPETGEPLSGEATHGAVDGGCIGCHHQGPDTNPPLRRGGTHAFRVDPGRCGSCHADKTADPSIRERALGLLARAGVPPHGAPANGPLDLPLAETPEARAIYDARLVAADPAAAWHNAPYARALLDAAESVLREGARR